MKVRTQLVVAFLLLSVVPLAALVLAATPGDEARAEGWAALVPPLATSGAPRVALLTARHLPTFP